VLTRCCQSRTSAFGWLTRGLLVRVGAETELATETSELCCCWQSVGRLLVDVKVVRSVDQRSLATHDWPLERLVATRPDGHNLTTLQLWIKCRELPRERQLGLTDRSDESIKSIAAAAGVFAT
jgi:hypothetical protein